MIAYCKFPLAQYWRWESQENPKTTIGCGFRDGNRRRGLASDQQEGRKRHREKNRQGHISGRIVKDNTRALLLVFQPRSLLSEAEIFSSAPRTLFLKRARDASALGPRLFHRPQNHLHLANRPTPSILSSLGSNVTFSVRPTLNTLFKRWHPKYLAHFRLPVWIVYTRPNTPSIDVPFGRPRLSLPL